MRSVLISIQPKWCELIANGSKTIEVRKTKPKLKTPFKAYIYCTKSKKHFLQSRSNMFFYCEDKDFIGGHGAGAYQRLNGRVIGEFVCDKVERITHCGTCNNDIRLNIVDKNFYCKALDYEYLNKCKLSYFEIEKYSNGGDVYGWHISDLVIYDKPRESSEFITPTTCKSGIAKEMLCNTCCLSANFCSKKPKRITRPPQSWCYVESLGDT